MNKLSEWLSTTHASQLEIVQHKASVYELFCQQHTPLFDQVLKAKPNTAAEHHLLGVLTKAHIEVSCQVDAQRESAAAMYDVLQAGLGDDHRHKFEEQGMAQLQLVTHLWLYMQGYLKMDFSLANDHAFSTAQLVNSITKDDIQALRTLYLESYYQGDLHSPLKRKFGILARVKHWLTKNQ